MVLVYVLQRPCSLCHDRLQYNEVAAEAHSRFSLSGNIISLDRQTKSAHRLGQGTSETRMQAENDAGTAPDLDQGCETITRGLFSPCPHLTRTRRQQTKRNERLKNFKLSWKTLNEIAGARFRYLVWALRTVSLLGPALGRVYTLWVTRCFTSQIH